MPDGRLGLLDYGMVGRITDAERLQIAMTILALASNHKTKVVRLYTEAGYQAFWKPSGDRITDETILHRLASLNLDRLDLSPIMVPPTTVTSSSVSTPQRMDIVQVLGSVVERHLPPWIEKSRRMGALLLGSALQAARPMSLSHEWKSMARQVVAQHDATLAVTSKDSNDDGYWEWWE